jgi:hypothetical protein
MCAALRNMDISRGRDLSVVTVIFVKSGLLDYCSKSSANVGAHAVIAFLTSKDGRVVISVGKGIRQ